MLLKNNFSGGTNGVTITPGNSGGDSGDAFNEIGDLANSINQYSNDTPHLGTMFGRFATRSTAGGFCGADWTGASIGTGKTDLFMRGYLRATALPTSLIDTVAHGYNSALTVMASKLQIHPNGQFVVRNAADQLIGGVQPATVITAAQWLRVEMKLHAHATAAYSTLRIYLDPDAAVGNFDEEFNPAGALETWAYTGTDIGFFAYLGGGSNANWPTATGFIDWAYVAVSDVDWIGPEIVEQRAYPVTVLSRGSWTDQAGGTTNIYASIDETSQDDADYIQSSPSPSSPGDESKYGLTPIDDPAVGTGHTVHWRYKKNSSGGDRIDLYVTLYRHDGTTVVHAEDVITDIDAITNGSFDLTTTEADSIPTGDYQGSGGYGLVLGFKAVKV